MTNLRPGEKHLILWKNQACIVMGRFQNPWLECHYPSMVKDGVKLARRHSGGGTVYHDLGNVCISFIDWNEAFDKRLNCELLTDTLASFDIKAHISARHDLYLERGAHRHKISGAAFKQKKDRSLHHMTLLLSTDLDKLNHYLWPKLEREASQSKAIDSVRSVVANTGVDEREFLKGLRHTLSNRFVQKVEFVDWQVDQVRSYCQQSEKIYQQLLSWEWIFGETPHFDSSFEYDGFKVDLAAKKGIISEFGLESDAIHPSALQQFSLALKGRPLKRESLDDALKTLAIEELPFYERHLGKLTERLARDFFF